MNHSLSQVSVGRRVATVHFDDRRAPTISLLLYVFLGARCECCYQPVTSLDVFTDCMARLVHANTCHLYRANVRNHLIFICQKRRCVCSAVDLPMIGNRSKEVHFVYIHTRPVIGQPWSSGRWRICISADSRQMSNLTANAN